MSLIKINNSRCKSCYLCVNTCPKALIKKSNKTKSINDLMKALEESLKDQNGKK